jgi:hypothetical protein
MENLTKVETAAALSAIRAVIKSSPGVPDNHPLETAAKKLDTNLKEFNARTR